MGKLNVHIKFIEGTLGTASNDKEIYSKFIASKAPDASTIEDEVASVGIDETIEKGTTVFSKFDDGTPFIWDYQIKGFFKDTCKMLSKLTKKDPVTGKKGKAVNESSKISAYKTVIDGLIFPQPRKIPFKYDGQIDICQRPLRAQTAQGERIALASSEEIHAGAELYFKVLCMDDDLDKAVIEWLEYGYHRGLSQWRNSGKGRFVYEILDDDGKPICGNMELEKDYVSNN